jgi:hypothetical protein
MAAAKAVNKDRDPIPCDPTVRPVVVDDQPVSIGQIDDPFNSAIFRSMPAKQERPNCLKVGQVDSSVGAEWWMLADQLLTPTDVT